VELALAVPSWSPDVLSGIASFGLLLFEVKDGVLYLGGNQSRMSPDLLDEIRQHKEEILAWLKAMAAKEKTIEEVAASWNEYKARHGDAPWLPTEEDDALQAEVGEAIRNCDLERALRTMEHWRRAREDLLLGDERTLTARSRVDARWQTVRRRVRPTDVGPGRWWRLLSEKEVAKDEDRVAQVDDAVIIGVSCVHAQGKSSSEEQVIEDRDTVAQVELAVSIGISAVEARRRDHRPGSLVDVGVVAIHIQTAVEIDQRAVYRPSRRHTDPEIVSAGVDGAP
jgi:hypothetical protein